jgi:hypothetical protein
MRVFKIVGRVGSIAQPAVSMPKFSINARNAFPQPSSPSTPTMSTRAAIETRLAATLPAPPRRSSERFAVKIGIGASGEMRETSPVT